MASSNSSLPFVLPLPAFRCPPTTPRRDGTTWSLLTQAPLRQTLHPPTTSPDPAKLHSGAQFVKQFVALFGARR
ncbi:hypothetical protein CEXT_57611 [Caerostris extrusa]|uniref:Uncharacterized protein n=1 Tax=Caerostris extrusa TaxID=172846 RepID=A0AAV4TVA4_CAEEX|nr:hypothetical protein CEXT_57611 [Caerostris extrusa]